MHDRPVCDLHMHTYYSDGRPSPEEVVQQAKRLNLEIIAITDHDNARGSREARDLAAQAGIELIPAVELTSRWDGYDSRGQGSDIDILGYFIDLDSPAFLAQEQAALDELYLRIEACCQRLTDAGYPVNLDDVLAENHRFPSGVPLIRALHHKGYAESWDAARPLYYAQWQHVRPSRFTVADNIAAIHAAGGVAVLAHPTIISHHDTWIQAEDIAALVEMGLDGIEIYHYRLNTEARAHFLALAEQFDLLVSGGSDEHGWQGFKRMGTEPVTREMVDALRAHSQQIRSGSHS